MTKGVIFIYSYGDYGGSDDEEDYEQAQLRQRYEEEFGPASKHQPLDREGDRNTVDIDKELEQSDNVYDEIASCPMMEHYLENVADDDGWSDSCVADTDFDPAFCSMSMESSTEPDQPQTADQAQQTTLSGKGNKRAEYLDGLGGQICEDGKLLLTTDGLVFAYQEGGGCFRPVPNLSAYLANRFSADISSGLLARDFREIGERLSWREDMVCSLDDFNSFPTKVNLENGVWDMESIQVLPHDLSYRFTYQVKAQYLEDSKEILCPEFDRFCKTSLDGDPAKRQLLLEFIGYICLDTNDGKCALFLKGQPNSGKSVITNLVTHLFDDELVANIPLHQLGDRFFRAELAGKKLNAAGEMAGKTLRDISIFKSITGNDRITGEFKNEDPFYFVPRCKLLFSGNTLPQTADLDVTAAFVNRIKVLLFNNSIEPQEQDKQLPDKLWAERDSIVTLALQSAKQLAERNFEFTQPEDSKKFLAAFELRGNALGQFLEECCVLAPEGRVFNKELFAAYTAFCEENGWKCESKQSFYDLLSGVPNVYAKRVRIGTENRQGHIGIALKGTNTPRTSEQQR